MPGRDENNWEVAQRLLRQSIVGKVGLAKQTRSPGAEQMTQVRVYKLPVVVDGPASLALDQTMQKRLIIMSAMPLGYMKTAI